MVFTEQEKVAIDKDTVLEDGHSLSADIENIIRHMRPNYRQGVTTNYAKLSYTVLELQSYSNLLAKSTIFAPLSKGITDICNVLLEHKKLLLSKEHSNEIVTKIQFMPYHLAKFILTVIATKSDDQIAYDSQILSEINSLLAYIEDIADGHNKKATNDSRQ